VFGPVLSLSLDADECVQLPRTLPDGTSLDHNTSYRKMSIFDTLEQYVPSLAQWALMKFIHGVQSKIWVMKPEWRLDPAPTPSHKLFIVSDDLISNLESGNVSSVAGVKRIKDAQTVELEDGQVVDPDTIILCTGFRIDYSVLGSHDPTRHDLTANAGHSPLPVLYRNLFSLDHPDSLACMGAIVYMAPAFEIFDLASMAIAQLWKAERGQRSPRFPPQHEMLDQVKCHLSFMRSLLAKGAGNPRWVRGYEWLAWIQDVIGCRLDEHLSPWSWQAWTFWWEDRELSNLMTRGIPSPHFHRVFDGQGRRKRWPGARSAIVKMNEEVKSGRTNTSKLK